MGIEPIPTESQSVILTIEIPAQSGLQDSNLRAPHPKCGGMPAFLNPEKKERPESLLPGRSVLSIGHFMT